MKRMLVAALVAGALLSGSAAGALALPDNGVSDAARIDQTCPNRHGVSERSTHGTYVSGVALGIYGAPADPYEPCVPIFTDD